MITRTLSRRGYLKRVTTGALAVAAAPAMGLTANSEKVKRQRVLRFAQITDIHVQPELGAADGFRQCLRHIRSQVDPVDMVFNTGDAVMDCLAQDETRVTLIWDLWNKILAEECTVPVHHVIGNHDIWGWHKKASNTTGDEPLWGKKIALANYKLSSPYYSFDQAGWHFVVLDTVQHADDGYATGLDNSQIDWLQKDLAGVESKTPILVLSHIPIIGVAPLLNNDALDAGDFKISATKILSDNVRVKNLFKQFPNVRLCLSGHIHLLDQIEYLGHTYRCGGAVCADYWKGVRNGECDAGYSLIDLYNDGSFDHEYVTYGWTYRHAADEHLSATRMKNS